MGNDENDIRDLWAKINGMGEKLAENATTLARIETLLSERCTSRGTVQDNLAVKVQRLEDKIAPLERKVWWMAGAATAAGALLHWVLRSIGGTPPHGG